MELFPEDQGGFRLYFLMSFIARVIGTLPESILQGMATGLGVFLFDVIRLRRSLMLRNIQIALPELSYKDRVAMARRSMVHLVTTVIELLWVWSNDMESRVSIANPEVFSEALSRDRGAYILCTHTGNFEAFAMIISRKFAKVTSPVKRVGSSPGLNRFIMENRTKQGMDAFVRNKKGAGFLAITRALAEKRVVGFMMDQARPGEPRLLLFGKPAKTNTSLGAIWTKCPAPVVAGYCERKGFARHVVHLLPEVQFSTSDDNAADILSRAAQCNTIVEQIVRRCPDQYWWVHDRWK